MHLVRIGCKLQQQASARHKSIRRSFSPCTVGTRRWRPCPAATLIQASPGYSLRLAQHQDASWLALIDQRCHDQGSAGWSQQLFEDDIASSLSVCVVAVRTGEPMPGTPIAFASCLVVAGEAQLQNLAVMDGAHRGRGLGHSLLSWLIKECGCLDSAPCLLEVRTNNAAAIKLYTKLGFQPTGLRRRFYPDGGDALLMERPPGL